jgi:hypothetical protein
MPSFLSSPRMRVYPHWFSRASFGTSWQICSGVRRRPRLAGGRFFSFRSSLIRQQALRFDTNYPVITYALSWLRRLKAVSEGVAKNIGISRFVIIQKPIADAEHWAALAKVVHSLQFGESREAEAKFCKFGSCSYTVISGRESPQRDGPGQTGLIVTPSRSAVC